MNFWDMSFGTAFPMSGLPLPRYGLASPLLASPLEMLTNQNGIGLNVAPSYIYHAGLQGWIPWNTYAKVAGHPYFPYGIGVVPDSVP